MKKCYQTQLSQMSAFEQSNGVKFQDFNYHQHFLPKPLITLGIRLTVFIGALGLQSISFCLGPCWDPAIQMTTETEVFSSLQPLSKNLSRPEWGVL